ncbi:MAG: site-specific integrase, partial [Alphaproteobacteria bacterium]|nr:site-specific integrase [Alphaproteobacteria bacterium]
MKAKKLPSGNYRVQVVAGYDVSGKRIVKSFTADEEWKVLKMAAEFVAKRNEVLSNDDTVRIAMERYVATRKNVIEETTYLSYKQIIDNRFASINGHQADRIT